jgi:hypothetical protein
VDTRPRRAAPAATRSRAIIARQPARASGSVIDSGAVEIGRVRILDVAALTAEAGKARA